MAAIYDCCYAQPLAALPSLPRLIFVFRMLRCTFCFWCLGADLEQNGRAGEPPECAGRGHDEPQRAS